MSKTLRAFALAMTLVMAVSILPAASFAVYGEGASLGGGSTGSSTTNTGSSQPAAPTGSPAVIYNCTDWVSMRAEASSKSTRLAKLNPGTAITVLGEIDGYYQVIYGSQTGYVLKDYVSITTTGTTTGTTGGNTGSSLSGNSSLGGGSTSGNTSGTTGGNTGSSLSGSSGLGGSTGGTTGGTTGGSTTGTTTGAPVSTPSSTGNSPTFPKLPEMKYAAYTGTSSDIWGTIQVDGTGINNNIYNNALNKKGQFYYNAYSSKSNNIYALSYLGNPISVIYGHNMRKSAKKTTVGLGLHDLNHVQNAWLGISKCEYCGRSCSGARTEVFNISYNGASKWKLVGFFELDSKTMSNSKSRYNMEVFASLQSTRSGSLLQEWINTVMSYCNSKYKGATLGSVSSSDKVMMIVTCADKSGDKNQRLYMILKAV